MPVLPNFFYTIHSFLEFVNILFSKGKYRCGISFIIVKAIIFVIVAKATIILFLNSVIMNSTVKLREKNGNLDI